MVQGKLLSYGPFVRCLVSWALVFAFRIRAQGGAVRVLILPLLQIWDLLQRETLESFVTARFFLVALFLVGFDFLCIPL